MEIPLQAHVECTDGRWGQSVYVLIDPVLAEITSLVAREDSAAGTEYIVPLELVVATLDGTIKLSCSKAEIVKLAPFSQTAFITAKVPDPTAALAGRYGLGSYFYLPYVTAEVNALVPTEELQIPKGELAVWRGTRVEATDGFVGKVDEFVVNPTTNRITYLVMREGGVPSSPALLPRGEGSYRRRRVFLPSPFGRGRREAPGEGRSAELSTDFAIAVPLSPNWGRPNLPSRRMWPERIGLRMTV